jgi:hypothetical protein
LISLFRVCPLIICKKLCVIRIKIGWTLIPNDQCVNWVNFDDAACKCKNWFRHFTHPAIPVGIWEMTTRSLTLTIWTYVRTKIQYWVKHARYHHSALHHMQKCWYRNNTVQQAMTSIHHTSLSYRSGQESMLLQLLSVLYKIQETIIFLDED